MSIGIVVATSSAVFLVADGRQSNAFTVLTNKAKKIVPITDSLSVIEFGAIDGTKAMVRDLKFALASNGEGKNVQAVIRDSVHRAGISLVSRVTSDSGNLARVKVGMLAAGIDSEGPFLAAALFESGMEAPSVQFARPRPGLPKVLGLGGEEQGALAHFIAQVSLSAHRQNGNLDGFLSVLQQASKTTIQHVAALDKTVGGKIRYRVMVKGMPPRDGVL